MTPTRRRSLLLGIGLGLAVSVVIAVVIARSSGGNGDVVHFDPNGASVGNLPDTSVLTLDSAKTTLRAYAGTPMVVNFWQQSCAPCRKEMPAFETVHQRYGDRVRFIGVDGGDELEVVQKYIAEVGVTYDIIRDPRYDLSTKMGVRAWPATAVFDGGGNLLKVQYGEMDIGQLTSLIDKALAQ